MAEDCRPVLAAEVEALAGAGGGVVGLPECLEQLRVAGLGRGNPPPDRLGMAGAVPAYPLVGGVRDVAAGVARSSLQPPVDLAEGRLHTPEASRGECGALGSVRSVPRQRRRRRRVGVAVLELDHVMAPLSSCANTKPAPGIPGGRHERRRPSRSKPRTVAAGNQLAATSLEA